MGKGLLSVVLSVLAVNAASGGEAFLSSPPYDITVTLEYTDPSDPYGDQGYIESYKSVSYFSRVIFGPSISPLFAASFASEIYPAGSGGTVPSMQKQGLGAIEYFTLQPAWESDDEAIEGEVVHGPEPFTPFLTIIDGAMAAEMMGTVQSGDMAILPIESTVWIMFNEGVSITDPELVWEYPGFAGNSLESSVVVFSVPRDDLGEGADVYIDIPYRPSDGNATGRWTIMLEADPQ